MVVVESIVQGRITGLLLNLTYIVVRLWRSALSTRSLLLLLEASSAFVTSTCICLRLIGGHPWLLMVLWRYNNPRRWWNRQLRPRSIVHQTRVDFDVNVTAPFSSRKCLMHLLARTIWNTILLLFKHLRARFLFLAILVILTLDWVARTLVWNFVRLRQAAIAERVGHASWRHQNLMVVIVCRVDLIRTHQTLRAIDSILLLVIILKLSITWLTIVVLILLVAHPLIVMLWVFRPLFRRFWIIWNIRRLLLVFEVTALNTVRGGELGVVFGCFSLLCSYALFCDLLLLISIDHILTVWNVHFRVMNILIVERNIWIFVGDMGTYHAI